MAKSKRKPIPAILKTPWTYKMPGPTCSAARAHREIMEQLARRVSELMKYYAIPPNTENQLLTLVLRMAGELFPGFQARDEQGVLVELIDLPFYLRKEDGQDKLRRDQEEERATLLKKVRRLTEVRGMAKPSAKSVLAALKLIADEMEPKATGSERRRLVDALRQRYYGAKKRSM